MLLKSLRKTFKGLGKAFRRPFQGLEKAFRRPFKGLEKTFERPIHPSINPSTRPSINPSIICIYKNNAKKLFFGPLFLKQQKVEKNNTTDKKQLE